MFQMIDTKLPVLTKEEWSFYKKHDAEFFKRYNLQNVPSRKKIPYALQSLALLKLMGRDGYKQNKEEAIQHHLKACAYDPQKVCLSEFRRATGLPIHEGCKECC